MRGRERLEAPARTIQSGMFRVSDGRKERDVQHLSQRDRLGRAQAGPGDRQDRPPGRWRRAWRRYGETTVLCTAVGAKTAKPGQDFFPLTVNYQEKTFAAGKIPGGFFKREGRPSEKETLVCAPDRPADPPAVRAGLPQRDAGRLHRAEPRPGERSRHRRPWSAPRRR